MKEISKALFETLISTNVSDSNGEYANLVDVIDKLAVNIGYGLKYLGNGDAGTSMGAIEAHGVCIKEAGENIASAIRELAEAIERRG